MYPAQLTHALTPCDRRTCVTRAGDRNFAIMRCNAKRYETLRDQLEATFLAIRLLVAFETSESRGEDESLLEPRLAEVLHFELHLAQDSIVKFAAQVAMLDIILHGQYHFDIHHNNTNDDDESYVMRSYFTAFSVSNALVEIAAACLSLINSDDKNAQCFEQFVNEFVLLMEDASEQLGLRAGGAAFNQKRELADMNEKALTRFKAVAGEIGFDLLGADTAGSHRDVKLEPTAPGFVQP